MNQFRLINHCLATTEVVDRLIKDKNLFRINFRDPKIKKSIVLWIEGLNKLSFLYESEKDYEPLLFLLCDHIKLDSSLWVFLNNFIKNFNHPKISKYFEIKDIDKKLNVALSSIDKWFNLSEMYYQKSLKNLHLIEGHSGNKFYCMIREFHPRKIYSKHVWNEIQAGPQRDRPTKDLVSYSELDPIAGHRFFTTDPIEKHGPAVGIAIFAGHHRIYELYRRYLNDKLKNFKFEGEKNGNVKVIFEEAW